jgi:hypothetical protein
LKEKENGEDLDHIYCDVLFCLFEDFLFLTKAIHYLGWKEAGFGKVSHPKKNMLLWA